MVVLSVNTVLLFFPNCLPVGRLIFLALLQCLGLPVFQLAMLRGDITCLIINCWGKVFTFSCLIVMLAVGFL